MTAPAAGALPSDALVFFGASGDLAYKQIFPALQAMVRRGALNVPAVGVGKSGWTLDQLRARARDSLESVEEQWRIVDPILDRRTTIEPVATRAGRGT